MKSGSRRWLLSGIGVLAGSALLSLIAADSLRRNEVASLTANSLVPLHSPNLSIADEPLEPYRLELLQLAYNAASSLPATPFIKDRARLQASVVDVCFELDQPRRALGYIENIDGWRRGAGYADFAFDRAKHGDVADVERFLELARQIANSASESEDSQDWEIDQIKSKVARAYAVLGDLARATALEATLVDSEFGKVDAVKATAANQDTFESQIENLDRIVATGNSERLILTLGTCVQLFGRFYDDPARRSRMETKIKTSFSSLPTLIRVDTLMSLAGIAAEHGDAAEALALLKQARATLDGGRWTPEYGIPPLARQAAIRYRAGEPAAARRDADAALAMFDAEREHIQSMERAAVLRSIAEAYQAMGDKGTAVSVYARAVDDGAENPNRLPRTQDLTATCCSMASHGVEPYGSLKLRIVEICDGLSQTR